MYKIAIDAGNLTPAGLIKNGTERLVRSFTEEFIKNIHNFEMNYYYFSTPSSPIKKNKSIVYHNLPTKFYGSFFLPLSILKNNDGVFLGFSGYIPRILKFIKVKKILFIYDFGFYKNPSLYNNSVRLMSSTEQSLRLADKIIVLNNHIKNELLARFRKIDKSKIMQIYAGIDHLSHLETDNKRQITNNKKYFLHVGMIKPSKNIDLVIEYFHEFVTKTGDKNQQLILIGKRELDYYQRIIKGSYYVKNKSRIKFLKDVSDEQLSTYYRSANAVLNFSADEGFCFPVMEGLSFGNPVIVNNLPIYEEYKKYFPNLKITKKPNEVISSMVQCLSNGNKLNLKIPDLFTWSNFTHELMQLLTTII